VVYDDALYKSTFTLLTYLLTRSPLLSVCLFTLYLLNRLTFELALVCGKVMTTAFLELKVEVTDQGQRLRSWVW